MAEPSLLCVNCASPPPPHRRTWGRCTVCIERNLPSTYYCGEECMNAHWPQHKVYHKQQKLRAEQIREGGQPERTRLVAEEALRRAEATGDEYDKRFAAAFVLGVEGDYNAAAKAWRKIIKQWPEGPCAYRNLAVVLARSDYFAEAAPMYLKAMELHEDGTKKWAEATACAFHMLKQPDCRDVPKPEWWNDEALKALSARVVALAPDKPESCSMRAGVLGGDALSKAPWYAAPRTAAEIKEAATWYRRSVMVSRSSRDKLRYEKGACQYDAMADPLLAEEEAEAEKARVAAEAEAAAALKLAETKAKAAAEELLAEEEKEQKQAEASTKAGKAKQSKGKKGKGKR